MLAAIRAAHARDDARRASAPTTPPSLGGSDEPVDPDKEYVQASVRDLLPFLKECYTTALDQGPSFGGDIVVDFTIEGTPETGGLVTEAAIDDDATDIDDVEFRECIRQTMFSLEIDPPTHGGSVKVSYPFMFSPG
jgi:hypothetical protein